MEPTVSVVMPVYNGAQYLREAVDSILAQTFADFEFIIVNDGSTDDTANILSSYPDARIRVMHNQRNAGVARALNRGLEEARGRYIARQDADDVSLPSRFKEQVQFLEANPGVVLVGSNAAVIGGPEPMLCLPASDLELRWTLLARNPFIHTSVMFRRAALQEVGPYSTDEAYRHCEDFELWSRMARVGRTANLQDPLVKWRAHGESVSSQNLAVQRGRAGAVAFANAAWLLDGVAIDAAMWDAWLKFWAPPRLRETPFSADEATRLVDFLPRLAGCFYRRTGFARRETQQHRRRLYYGWGRHALALALRTGDRGMRARLQFGRIAARFLAAAALP